MRARFHDPQRLAQPCQFALSCSELHPDVRQFHGQQIGKHRSFSAVGTPTLAKPSLPVLRGQFRRKDKRLALFGRIPNACPASA